MRVWNEGKYTVYTTGLVAEKNADSFNNLMDQAIEDSLIFLEEFIGNGTPRYYISAHLLKDAVTKRFDRPYTPKGAVIIAAIRMGLKLKVEDHGHWVGVKVSKKHVNIDKLHKNYIYLS